MRTERAGDVFELMETLKQFRFEELRLEMDGFKFHAVKNSRSDTPRAAETGPRTGKELRPIVAPRLGIFRRVERPGAPVPAALGQRVQEKDVVGFIRVLEKTYPVPSGVGGVIERICAEDGAMVEFNQPLFLVGGKERV